VSPASPEACPPHYMCIATARSCKVCVGGGPRTAGCPRRQKPPGKENPPPPQFKAPPPPFHPPQHCGRLPFPLFAKALAATSASAPESSLSSRNLDLRGRLQTGHHVPPIGSLLLKPPCSANTLPDSSPLRPVHFANHWPQRPTFTLFSGPN